MLIKLKKIINGCTKEADLDYLKELQSLHNNYLLFPEESDIKKSMLFDYYRQIMSKQYISLAKKSKNLWKI